MRFISRLSFLVLFLLGIVSCNSNKQNVIPFADGSDISTSSVGVMTGTTGEMYIRANYPQAQVQCYDDIMDAIAALQSNKVKYVMTAYTTAVNAAKYNKDLFILPKEYTDAGAVIALPKGKATELQRQINAVLEKYRNDGTLSDIVNRWVNLNSSEYREVDIPVLESGKKLIVGIAANREPMCFIKDGKIVGLDCELIERIAFELGFKVEYMDMKFSALITSLASGKIDAIISNLTATKERGKMVDFSDSYFVNPQILMCSQDEIQGGVGVSKKPWYKKISNSFYNNLILEKRYLLILNGLKVTFIISILAALIGTLLGALICFMRMSKNMLMRGIAKVYIDLLRGIPQVVLLMIMFYVVFASLDISGIIVAAITFAMNFAAYVSEMFRTSISSISYGQTEAGLAMGFGKVKTFRYVVLPQAIDRVLPVYKGEFISLVKMTSIVGYIAVQDLTKASDIIRSRTFDAFFPLIVVAIIYFLLAWLLSLLLGLIKTKRVHL